MNLLTFINTYYEYYILFSLVLGFGAVLYEMEDNKKHSLPFTINNLLLVLVFGILAWPIAIAEKFWKWID